MIVNENIRPDFIIVLLPVTTPFFVTQTFTRENGKWWMTAMVFTTRTAGPGIDPNSQAAH